MVSEFQTPISAEAVKSKAMEFGADLVGVGLGDRRSAHHDLDLLADF